MMTLEQQRIAIAEWMGLGERLKLEQQWDKGTVKYQTSIPNYPLDLNAMHKAEKKLTGAHLRDYFLELQCVIIGTRQVEPNKEIALPFILTAQILCWRITYKETAAHFKNNEPKS